LILRDCFLGLSRFEQFADSTGMTRHVLADRLKRLVEADILVRKAYSQAPKRYDYVLTQKGQELEPALMTLRDWGKKHLPVRRATSP
jgi:DNA-binding HxlR family transcriptional regulator